MLHRLAKWAYNWVTVITGVVTGALTFLPPMLGQFVSFLDVLGPVDWTQWGISPIDAARITTIIAVAKGTHAFYCHRRDRY